MDNKTAVELIKQGDKETIQETYKKYAVDVYKFAKNMTHDHDLSMKATEQTFLELFGRIRNGETPDDLRKEALKTVYLKTQELLAQNADEPAAEAETETQEQEKEPEQAEEPIAECEAGPQEQAEEPEPEEEEVIPAPADDFDFFSLDLSETDEPEENAGKPEIDEEFETDEVSNTRVIDISDAPEEGDRLFREDEELSSGKYYYDDEEYDDEEDEDTAAHKGLFALLVVLNVILILLLLWLLVGLLVNLDVLPDSIDLGYTWFNSHIYPIF